MVAFNPGDDEMILNPIRWLRRFLRSFGIEAFAKRYYGTYAGFVVANADPDGLYRIRATCPAVGITDVAAVPPDWWAWPCMPGLGNDADGATSGDVWVPDVGSPVWLQFEHGEPEHPIYAGGFVTEAQQMPELAHAAALRKGMRTRSGHFLRFSDDPADLHITIGKGDGAGSQTASFLTFDKKGNVTVSNDVGSLIFMDAENGVVSVWNADADGTTQSMCVLGQDEVSLCTKSGGSFGIKGRDITLSGDNIALNGIAVSLSTLQLYLGKGAAQPAVLGTDLATMLAAHTHTVDPSTFKSSPPLPPPLVPGKGLSMSVFVK